ncbi:MAG TPA: hypothetical protein VN634_13335 [Candidatus Limnocylindrales bacterium]|nr:hypothetical protein [Candidatus Limnocylindrales bacterium]
MGRSSQGRDVALFLGESTVVDPLVHALVGERMGASSQSLDFEIFRFGERPIAEIEAALRQVGMFSPQRAIWLRGFAEAKRKAATDSEDGDDEDLEEAGEGAGGAAALLALLEAGIPGGTLLVVSAGALDARGRLYKWFAKNADVVDRRIQIEQRGKLKEEGLRRAIAARLEDLGVRKVGAGVVEEIVKRSGNVLGETLQEVDRLVLSQSDPARLEARDVQSGMRDLALGWVFDFTSSLEKRDLASAENLIARLLADGEPPLRLSALLASHVAKLVDAWPLVDTLPRGWLRMSGAEFLAGPGAGLPDSMRGWPGYFRLRAAADFGEDALRRLHGEVRRLDAALKSSPVSPVLLFSRLLQSACIRNPAG